jgi:hypothetical protein
LPPLSSILLHFRFLPFRSLRFYGLRSGFPITGAG